MAIIIAITGPAGSGKSTIAEQLAKDLKNTVNIDADSIKHMIISGFYYETTPDREKTWGFNQWGLVGDSVGLLAHNFLVSGFDVIINGYMDEPAWSNISKHIEITHKILLMPDLDTTIRRDSLRHDDLAMGKHKVKEHHEHFSDNDLYKTFLRLDTSNQSVEETVKMLENLL